VLRFARTFARDPAQQPTVWLKQEKKISWLEIN
jgi:hypothetical protein